MCVLYLCPKPKLRMMNDLPHEERMEATVVLTFSFFLGSPVDVKFYGNEKSSNVKLPVRTDQDTLREGYRFIRSEEDDMDTSWEQRLVKRYYDKLFKEYPTLDEKDVISLNCFISLMSFEDTA
ncbi:Protein FRA10AC1 [Linum grandiflorum]